MPVKRYAICDECGNSKIEYMKLKNRDTTNFKYGEIVESGEPAFARAEQWLVKAFQDPDDPIAITFEYFCPDCVVEDAIEDTGDRAGASSNGS